MSFIARVYCNDRLYSVDLSKFDRVTIGSDNSDTLKLENCGLKKGHISITKSSSSHVIKAKGMYDRDDSPVSSDIISVGKTYSIDCEHEVYIAIHPKQADGNKSIRLDYIEELYIGRGNQNNVILNNKRTSTNHCKIYRTSGLLKIRDLRSSNGTYVNGIKINEKTLSDGDVINIAVYEIILKNNALIFYNDGDDLEFNLERAGGKCDTRTFSVFGVDSNATIEKISDSDEDTYIRSQAKNGTVSIFDID